MTLKEELEILRGEPIEVFDGDPMDIPCIETSDAEKLCKHPVVSVHMITYNHEPYIRQAIEGVMMQKTDFEFELVIGEDCSQDKTREICFEYQKKYPDKIRVLWWPENVSKLGGNGRRNRARCRGEFIAFCEGDDYWIDPLKLQKQVDVMRKHPGVGVCFCNADLFYQATDVFAKWSDVNAYKPGVVRRQLLFLAHLFGQNPYIGTIGRFIITATILFRKSAIEEVMRKYDVMRWRLRMGDTTLCLGVSSLYDGYYIPDVVSIYRVSNIGICSNPTTRPGILIDGTIVRLYYAMVCLKLCPKQIPSCQFSDYMAALQIKRLCALDGRAQRQYYKDMVNSQAFFDAMMKPFHWLLLRIFLRLGMVNNRTVDAIYRFHYMFYVPRVSRSMKSIYVDYGVPLIRRRIAILNNTHHFLFKPLVMVWRIWRKFLTILGAGNAKGMMRNDL